MSRRLLIVNQRQFGYHITYYNYCKYLKGDFDITFLCVDCGYSKIVEEGIRIIYVSFLGNIIKRKLIFIKKVLELIKEHEYHYIFIKYFKGCFIIPLIYRRNHWIHLDIVTGSIALKSMRRNLFNLLLRYESYFFKSVSVISLGMQKLLKVSCNAYILPMGANPLFINRQIDHKISLLYIGTLENRHIYETVLGLGLFISKYPDADVHYTIIGNGSCGEIDLIKENINKYGLDRHVELVGYVAHNNLIQFYEKANVGVSYIPITSWFEYQPPIKTFEYLMSGMPVIATDTYENRKVITEQNGLISSDNPVSFANCIELFYDNIDNYSERIIRESVAEYKWEIIVSGMKKYIMDQI